tara:strand:- start:228 stop:362 length:135 start_codon:yes stop_codon:yes gene_type:complete
MDLNNFSNKKSKKVFLENLLNKIEEISRVVFTISSKPSAIIGWE